MTFTRFDLRNAFASGGRLIAPLALVLLVSILTAEPAFAVLIAVAVGSLAASGPFLGDERDHLDTLYATLPLSRSAVVVGRYLTAVVVYLVAAAVGTVASVVTGAVRGSSLDVGALGEAEAIGLFVVALALAVQLPVFFAIGYTRGRPMMYVPLVVLAAAAWGAGQLGLIDGISGSIAAIDSGLLSLAAVLVGLGVLAASAVIATAVYRRRAL